ncbi:MAG: ATP-binding protein [Planctomycetes bacterium]|nr:ATP-binding protein [Planctomycetota bacterium]
MQVLKHELFFENDEVLSTHIQLVPIVRYLALNRALLEQSLQVAKVPPPVCADIILAVDEAISNVMEHSLSEKDSHENLSIFIDMRVDKKSIKITIQDPGTSFNPLTLKAPDLGRHIRSGNRGGLGVYIIKKIMDSLSYEYADGRNCLTLEKILN